MPIERENINVAFETVPRIDSARLIQRDAPRKQSGGKNGDGQRDGHQGAHPDVPIDIVELGPALPADEIPIQPPALHPDRATTDDQDRHLDIQA